MSCELCKNGQYPHYGLAPHRHNAALGNTGFHEQESWPANFEPDLDDDGNPMPIGTYYCPAEDCKNNIKELGLNEPIRRIHNS